MVILDYHPDFKRRYEKLDKSVKEKISKILAKIISNPQIGKPMRYHRKGTRELYIKPFRLFYGYFPHENKIIILKIYHKKKQ